jgi:hypothetical protein
MIDHTNTYPDLVNVEDWLNAKGYTGEAGACHQAMSLIRKQEKRIAELKAALKDCADELEAWIDETYKSSDGSVFSQCKFQYDRDIVTVRAARAALGEKE